MAKSASGFASEMIAVALGAAHSVAETAQGPVYVAGRNRGQRIWDTWQPAGRWRDGLTAVLGNPNAVSPRADLFEICLTRAPRSAVVSSGAGPLSNAHRGIRGIEVSSAGHTVRFAPTEMVARNLSFPKALEIAAEMLAEARGGVGGEGLPADAAVATFEAEQVLLWPGPPPRAVRVVRGMTPVLLSDVTRTRVEEAARRMANWLAASVSDEGRMIYKYWPSRGREAPSNNMLRQWMATICLGRWARRQHDTSLQSLALRNLRYNLNASFRKENGLGLIECDGKVKLGAVALAALAVAESPERQALEHVEAALSATVDALWDEGGSFRTFLRPAGRNDCQNFYPGEALLYWSHRLARKPDPMLLSRFLATAAHYQAWHRARRNPAFVPWHTQAYYAVWRLTGDASLREAVFSMNDWLVRMQQWETAPYADMRGRFYDPLHPDYGPPHASSDGVYLEGLADAFSLAREAGDAWRAEEYRTTVARGLRHVLQLQFADEAGAFYASRRHRVDGALRTTVYDNTIRVDNVQHNLIAAMKILNAFSDDDYQVPA